MRSAKLDGGRARAPRFRYLHLLAAVFAVSSLALTAVHINGLPTAWAAPEPLSAETTYVTPFGQHRDIALPGIVVSANTETTLHAQHSPTSVHLTLTRGEIVADASKAPSVPFVIAAGELQIESSAPNTVAWARRHDDHYLTLGILSGSTYVYGHTWSGRRLNLHLQAGQFATFRRGTLPVVEHREQEELVARTAWRAGEVRLIGDPLSEVIAEFNRYNTRQLVILDPWTASLRPGGRFFASQPEAFAKALGYFGVHHSVVRTDPKDRERILLYAARGKSRQRPAWGEARDPS